MHGKETLPDHLLQLLADGRWHGNDVLALAVGHRLAATMHVLRQRGDGCGKRHIDGQRLEDRLMRSRVGKS